jgi:hypothetical protein
MGINYLISLVLGWLQLERSDELCVSSFHTSPPCFPSPLRKSPATTKNKDTPLNTRSPLQLTLPPGTVLRSQITLRYCTPSYLAPSLWQPHLVCLILREYTLCDKNAQKNINQTCELLRFKFIPTLNSFLLSCKHHQKLIHPCLHSFTFSPLPLWGTSC